MSISDEVLMAYADGELGARECAEVEAAMQADAEVARRVEQHRALRKDLGEAFGGVLREAVPERLIAAARAMPRAMPIATVTELARVRAARSKGSVARVPKLRAPAWLQWGALAASLVIGGLVGFMLLRSPDTELIATQGGHLVARGALAQALSDQLASTPSAGSLLHIGVSFRAKSGGYCRTFILRAGSALGGLACREGETWRLHTLAESAQGVGADGGYQPAGSALPPAVLTAVAGQIAGDPLDAAGEAAARKRNWRADARLP
jgi:hypothetical protein